MKIGPIEILKRVRRSKRPQPADDVERCLANLAALAGMLEGVPWLLGGGLSIPLTLGRFYRRHRDVDVVVRLEDLGAMDAALSRHGYRLVAWFNLYVKSIGVDLRITTRPSSLLLKVRRKKLKFVDPRRQETPESLIASIDVYPYVETGEFFETCDYRRRIPKPVPVAGPRVSVRPGVELRCLNLHYVDRLKALRGGTIHQLDRTVIADGVRAAGQWGVQPSPIPSEASLIQSAQTA